MHGIEKCKCARNFYVLFRRVGRETKFMEEVNISDSWDKVEIGKIGIWLFILTEIMLFGAFFSSYVMIRWGSSVCALGRTAWPQTGFKQGLILALTNTVILITSSFTMVRSYEASCHRDESFFKKSLLVTILLGILFLVIKFFEYALKIHHGYFPGSSFLETNPGLTIFFSFYFMLTGLHALHVIIGVCWNSFLFRSFKVSGFSDQLTSKLEYAGIYWHFVDIIWVFLFPLFYLI